MGPRILVADDEPRLLHIVSMYLSMESFEVTCAADGEAALALLATQHFDLAILDVMMPVYDGLEVCRRLRSGSLSPSVPVVLFTALSSDPDVEEGRLAGANHYITKPFSLPGLGRVVHDLLAAPALPATA